MQPIIRVLVERFLGWFKGYFRRQRVSLVITDSEAYDIVPNNYPRSPGCGVGTVIGHGSSGLSRAGFWRRRVLQSGFEIPWTSNDQPNLSQQPLQTYPLLTTILHTPYRPYIGRLYTHQWLSPSILLFGRYKSSPTWFLFLYYSIRR